MIQKECPHFNLILNTDHPRSNDSYSTSNARGKNIIF